MDNNVRRVLKATFCSVSTLYGSNQPDTHRAEFVVARGDFRDDSRVPLALSLARSHVVTDDDLVDTCPVLTRADGKVRDDIDLALRAEARPVAQRAVLDVYDALERSAAVLRAPIGS